VDTGGVLLGDFPVTVAAGGSGEVFRMGDLLDVDVTVDTVPEAVNGIFIGFRINMEEDVLPVDLLDPAGIVVAVEATFVAEVGLDRSGKKECQAGDES